MRLGPMLSTLPCRCTSQRKLMFNAPKPVHHQYGNFVGEGLHPRRQNNNFQKTWVGNVPALSALLCMSSGDRVEFGCPVYDYPLQLNNRIPKANLSTLELHRRYWPASSSSPTRFRVYARRMQRRAKKRLRGT